jgi:hypothetical protein
LTIADSLYLPHDNTSLEQSIDERLAINVAFTLKKA